MTVRDSKGNAIVVGDWVTDPALGPATKGKVLDFAMEEGVVEVLVQWSNGETLPQRADALIRLGNQRRSESRYRGRYDDSCYLTELCPDTTDDGRPVKPGSDRYCLIGDTYTIVHGRCDKGAMWDKEKKTVKKDKDGKPVKDKDGNIVYIQGGCIPVTK